MKKIDILRKIREFLALRFNEDNRKKTVRILLCAIWLIGIIVFLAVTINARGLYRVKTQINAEEYDDIFGYELEESVFIKTDAEPAGIVFNDINVSTKSVSVYFKQPLDRDMRVRLYTTNEIYDRYTDGQRLQKTVGKEQDYVFFVIQTGHELSSLKLEIGSAANHSFEIDRIILNESRVVRDAFILELFRNFVYFVLFTVLCLTVFLFYTTNMKLENKFLIIAGILGTCYVFVLTPFQHDDESNYYLNAYYWSDVIMFDDSTNMYAQHNRNSGILPYQRTTNVPEAYITLLTELRNGNIFLNSDETIEISRTSRTFIHYFAQSLPAAVGIVIARLLNGNIILLLYTARFFNFMFYLIMLYFTIKKLSGIQTDYNYTIFILGISSTALAASSTVVGDVFGNALAFLLIANVIYAIYTKGYLKKPCYICILLCSIFIAPFKIVYFPLCFLCLLIPKEKFKSVKEEWIKKASIIIASFAFLLLFQLNTMVNVSNLLDGTSLERDLYEVGFILKHPVRTAGMILKTLEDGLSSIILRGLQGIPQISGGPVIISLLMVILVMLSITNKKDNHILPNGKDKLFFICIALAVVVMIYVGEILHWTNYGSVTVEGIQARYFFPILPLVCFALKSKNFVYKKDINIILAGIAIFLQCWTIGYVVRTTVERF